MIIGSVALLGLALLGFVIYRCSRNKKVYDVPEKSPAKEVEEKKEEEKASDDNKSNFNGKEKLRKTRHRQVQQQTTSSNTTVVDANNAYPEKKK